MTTQTGVAVASAACIASLVPVALRQSGIVQHLPDPRCQWFDSNGITASRAAHPLGVPDSLLGMASFGVTLGLACTMREHPAVRRALALKIAFDGCAAAVNTVRQIVSFGRICSWCMGTVLTSAVLVWSGRRLLRKEL